MNKERIIIEFDNWQQDFSLHEIEQIREAIDAGDFEIVGALLNIANADDIRVERAVEKWEVVR